VTATAVIVALEIAGLAIVYVYLRRRRPFNQSLKISDELVRRLPREFATTTAPRSPGATCFARGAATTAYRSFPFDLSADEHNIYLTPLSAYLVRNGGMNYSIPKDKIHDTLETGSETTFRVGGMHVVLHPYSGVPLTSALAVPPGELEAFVPPPPPSPAPPLPFSLALAAPLLVACLLLVLGGSWLIATSKVAVGVGLIAGAGCLAVLGSWLATMLRRAVGRGWRNGSVQSLEIMTLLLVLPYLVFGWVLLLFGAGDAILAFLAGLAFAIPIALGAVMLTLHRMVTSVPVASAGS
jgi:hypothetical protein